MNWSTELLEYYEKYGDKSLLRENKINSVTGEKLHFPVKSPYYRNIKGLRAPNLKFDITEEENLKSIYWISNPKDTDIFLNNIKLGGYQKEIIKNINKNKFTIFNTSRQIGMTTCAIMEILHFLVNNPGKTSIFIGIDRLQLVGNYKRLFEFYRSLPFFIKPGIKSFKDGKNIIFDNGSRIFFHSTTKSEIVREIDYLILGDFAYHVDDAEVINNLFPILMSSKSPKCLIYSNPNKSDDQFAKIYLNRKNMFKCFEYSWGVVEDRDSDWEKNEIRNLGSVDSFITSHECQFPGTKSFKRVKNLLLLGI